MSREEEAVLLTGWPKGTDILASESYRPGYRAYPLQVTMRTPEGSTSRCVTKASEIAAVAEREASRDATQRAHILGILESALSHL